MYKGGYTGKILRINLTDQTSKTEELPLEVARDFIGGAGLGIKYLYDEIEPGTDPLGSGNKLIFAPGPFTGTRIPCVSRIAVTGKSPLTNAVGMALSGGHFPNELKLAGYDALIVEGKAEKPVYVSIKDEAVEFRPADRLWGMKTTDTQEKIKQELNDEKARIACIGPAGENMIKIAAIINEMRAVGRKGLGAVMGSKNLKAIAVRGSGSVSVASEDKLKAARDDLLKAMKASPLLYPQFSKMGTSLLVDLASIFGLFPAKNFTATGEFLPFDTLGEKIQKTRNVGSESCYGCPVGCSQVKKAQKAPYEGIQSEGPEYETMYSYGGMTGVDNIDAIIAADRLSDELGLDTMSAGATIAFAMELYEKGILTNEETGGLELNFGNHQAMVKLIEMMAKREGFGDVLADGAKAAAEKIGKETGKYAMHVKGLELPAYDVRAAKAHGLNYATSYTGADHNRGYAGQEIFGSPFPYAVQKTTTRRKGKLTKWNQDVRTATADCPTMCVFILDMALAGTATKTMASLLEGVTGLEYTPESVQQVGERVNNLARAFNVREGFNRKDDTLPERLMTEEIKAGASKGQVLTPDDLNLMLDEYYEARGWDIKTGIPTKEKLAELGLQYVSDNLA
jgi:aldehyde:ferredoxin oxidoreductase